MKFDYLSCKKEDKYIYTKNIIKWSLRLQYENLNIALMNMRASVEENEN